MNRKRYLELDRLNVIFCLIVVFIHVFGIYTAQLTDGSMQQTVFAAFMKNCAFVVQGFMFLSAAKYALIYKEKKIKYFKFIKGRIKKVVLPYVLCVMVYYLVFMFLGFIESPSFAELFRYILNGTLSAQFYFVIAIIQFYVLLPLWLWLAKKVDSIVLVASACIVYGLWLYYFAGICVFFDRVFLTYLPFWAAGLAAGRHYTKFRNKIKSHKAVVLIVFMLMYIANGFLKLRLSMSPVALEALHTLYAASAICASYALFAWSEGKLSVIGRGLNDLSFDIYLWHCLALPIIDIQMSKISFSMLWHHAVFRAGIMYFIIFLAALIKGMFNQRRKKL